MTAMIRDVWPTVEDTLEWIGERFGTLFAVLGGALLLATGPLAIIASHQSVVARMLGLHR